MCVCTCMCMCVCTCVCICMYVCKCVCVYDVEPANSINFDLVLGKTLETSLLIRNSRSSTIVFKVKTTAPKRYCVRPNCCLVSAGEQVKVKIIMQALKEIPPVL